MSKLSAFCLAALTLLCADRLAAQEHVLSIRFEAQVGHKASVLIRRTKTLPERGPISGPTAVAVYRMEVTGKSADGYRILWTPQSLEFEGVPENVAAQVKAMAAGSMIPFEFDADRAGMPVKVANRERALEMALGALSRIANIDPAIVAQVRSMFTSMDERMLAGVLAKEAALLALWQNADLVVGKPNVFQELRANPFGGGELNSMVKADATLATPTLATINWQTEMDAKLMLADMIEWLKKTGSQMGRKPGEVEAQLGDAQLTFEEIGAAEVNPADGWTRAVTLKRLVRIASRKAVQNRDELVDIKLTRDP